MLFFSDLLELLNEKTNFVEQREYLLESFSLERNFEFCKNIFEIAIKFFNDEQIYFTDKTNYPYISESYENLFVHRWVSIIIINKVKDMFKLDSKKFFKLYQSTLGSIPNYLIVIDNIDLSGSNFNNHVSIFNLTNVKLRRSKFHGTILGVCFSGADLSNSEIDVATKFISCNFSGANLSEIIVDDTTTYNAYFINCKFNNCKLIKANMQDVAFHGSDFEDADISGAKLNNSIFEFSNLSKIVLDNDTGIKNIQLSGDPSLFDYNKTWNEIKSNKPVLDFLLSKLDNKLKDKLLDQNPELNIN